MGTGRRQDGADAPRGPVLRRWRVPTRLTVLILTPTVVGVVLAGARVFDSAGALAAHDRARTAVALSGELRGLAEALAMERDRSIWFRVTGRDENALAAHRRTVDELAHRARARLDAVGGAYGPAAATGARQVAGRLGGLAAVRQAARPDEYDRLVAALLAVHAELERTGEDGELAAAARALGALAHAKEEVARQRAALLGVLPTGRRLTAGELEEFIEDFITARARQQERIAAFHADAGPEHARHLAAAVAGPRVARAELTKSWAIALATHGRTPTPAKDRLAVARQWFADTTDTIDRMRLVEHRLADAAEGRARELRENELREAWLSAALILLLLLLVLATTARVARSLVRPLRRLRAEALEIAGHRLPETVRRLRADDVPEIPPPTPIGVAGRDEIGEVARAFDEVHRQAVRVAAEQARLRANISAMFVNLSRRTQTLVERQIDLIDGLERGEEDGARLGELFKLDHLATRMRRNCENLLVLAGHDPARRRSSPAPLIDVVRAAVSEVEDYDRVSIQVQRDVSVAGHAAGDVVHLVAELVENALTFSSRPSKVVVSSSVFDGDAALLAIGDTGVGMSPEQLAEANRRLADPPAIDVSVSRRMGLFVVGRLALRHSILVQLRPGQDSGVIAMVLLPPGLVIRPAPRPEPPLHHAGLLPPAGPSPAYRPAGHPGEPRLWNAPVPEDADPLPAVSQSRLEEGDEYLPIYASIGRTGPRPPSPESRPETSSEPTPGPGSGPLSGPPLSRPSSGPLFRSSSSKPSSGPASEPPGSFPGPSAGPPSGSFAERETPSGGLPGPRAAWDDPTAYGMPVVNSGTPPRPDPESAAGGVGGPRPEGEVRDHSPGGRAENRQDAGGRQETASGRNHPPGENFTSAGLPRRRPRAASAEPPPAVPPAPPPSPEETRERLARLQEGTRRGRERTAGDPVERSDHEEEDQ